jgi:hypothetical protein
MVTESRAGGRNALRTKIENWDFWENWDVHTRLHVGNTSTIQILWIAGQRLQICYATPTLSNCLKHV